jgi:hypothetical protein
MDLANWFSPEPMVPASRSQLPGADEDPAPDHDDPDADEAVRLRADANAKGLARVQCADDPKGQLTRGGHELVAYPRTLPKYNP